MVAVLFQHFIQILVFIWINKEEIDRDEQILMSLSLIFWIFYNIIVSRGFLKAMEIEDYEFYAG
jgi:hypothetical protein